MEPEGPTPAGTGGGLGGPGGWNRASAVRNWRACCWLTAGVSAATTYLFNNPSFPWESLDNKGRDPDLFKSIYLNRGLFLKLAFPEKFFFKLLIGRQEEKMSLPQVHLENGVLTTTTCDPLWQSVSESLMWRERFEQHTVFPKLLWLGTFMVWHIY